MASNDNGDNKKKEINEEVSRRKFLKSSGIAAGGVVGGFLLGGFLDPFKSEESTSLDPKSESNEKKYTEARMFFMRFEDFVVLEQATERIFPEDDNGIGAIKLGVPYYIDKQLAGAWGENGKDYRLGPFPGLAPSTDQSSLTRGEIFLAGLRKMNQLSKERFDTSFNEADEEQQIEILEAFEQGDVDLIGVDSGSFFKLLRDSTLEGVYSDPMYGGNRNMEGWKMKEFPGAIAAYADIIEQDEFAKMEPISLTDYQQKS